MQRLCGDRMTASRLVGTLLRQLDGYSGFDHWWDNIDDDIKADIRADLQMIVRGYLAKMETEI